MIYASVCSGVEAATLAWKSLGWKPAWFSEIEPFPCEVLKQRFPEVPNLGDMTKITVKNLPDGSQEFSNGNQTIKSEKVDLLVGGTPCFVADTLVLTPFGYKPIQDLKVGDEVISHIGNVCKVTDIGSKDANVGTIDIVGREKITCTDNHPFYCCWEQHKKSIKFDFTMAKYCKNKYAGRVYQNPELNDCDIDKNIIKLAGWFVGSGEVFDKKIIIKIQSKRIFDLFNKTFENCFAYSTKENSIQIEDEKINSWMINYFYHENDFCVPYFIYSYKYQHLFIDGFVDSTEQKSVLSKFYYRTRSLALSFADLFGNHSVKKDLKTGKWYSCENKKTKLFGDRFASIVKEFKDGNGTIRTVYNITVEHDHTYIAEGLAVHNCQGFSVAGKQHGLNDERSAIALSYIRLLKEMQPRFFVWENVPGVFSTNNGNDFKEFLKKINEIGYCCAWRVLDAQFCRVDGFPRAIPQRRRRVFVVGYFGEEWEYPAEILFEPEIVSWDNPPKRVKGKGFTTDVERSTGTTDRNSSKEFGEVNGINFEMWTGECKDISPALQHLRSSDTMVYGELENNENYCFQQNTRNEVRYINQDGQIAGALSAELGSKQQNYIQEKNSYLCYENHAQDSRIKEMNGSCQALSARMGTGGGNLPLVQEYSTIAFEPGIAKREGNNSRFTDEFSGALRGNAGDNQTAVAIQEKTECFNIAFCDANGTRKDRPNGGCYITNADASKTISTSGLNSETVIIDSETIAIDGDKIAKKERKGGSGFGINEDEVMYTQTAKDVHAVAYNTKNKLTVRRLLPLECERLMGFPDNHTRISWRGKKPENCPDAPRYKACGNSMCVNVMRWIGMRIDYVEKKKKNQS